jgi:hypothetical protein
MEKQLEHMLIVFISHYDRITISTPIRRLLMLEYEKVINSTATSYRIPQPIMAYKNMPSLGTMLVQMKQKIERKTQKQIRVANASTATMVQFLLGYKNRKQ